MKRKHIVCQHQHGCKAEQSRLGLVQLGHRSVVMQVRHAWCGLVQRHVPTLLLARGDGVGAPTPGPTPA